MRKKNQHVVPRGSNWAVRGAGNLEVSSVHKTQRGAIRAARRTAIQRESEVLIHRRNGRIRARNTYGRDPYPPKG